jgi:hypothetical protein
MFVVGMSEVVSESSLTFIAVTASVKEDEREDTKVTLPQAYCISLPHDTGL